jgi:hypothetical protein
MSNSFRFEKKKNGGSLYFSKRKTDDVYDKKSILGISNE